MSNAKMRLQMMNQGQAPQDDLAAQLARALGGPPPLPDELPPLEAPEEPNPVQKGANSLGSGIEAVGKGVGDYVTKPAASLVGGLAKALGNIVPQGVKDAYNWNASHAPLGGVMNQVGQMTGLSKPEDGNFDLMNLMKSNPNWDSDDESKIRNILMQKPESLMAMNRMGQMSLGAMDPGGTETKEFRALGTAIKDIDDIKPKIDFAIKNKDLPTMALMVNKLAGISSVAIQQGVVSDEEARRVMAGVMSNFGDIQAKGFDVATVQRFLRSDAWKSAVNMAASVQDGLKARMRVYKDLYNVPKQTFDRIGIQIDPSPQPEGNLDPRNVVTQEEVDKMNELAALEAAKLRGKSVGESVPTAVEAGIEGIQNYFAKKRQQEKLAGELRQNYIDALKVQPGDANFRKAQKFIQDYQAQGE